MHCTHHSPITRDLDRAIAQIFHAGKVIFAARAALGLLAVLESWPERQGFCKLALRTGVCHEVVVALIAWGGESIFCVDDPSDGLVPAAEWLRARSIDAIAA